MAFTPPDPLQDAAFVPPDPIDEPEKEESGGWSQTLDALMGGYSHGWKDTYMGVKQIAGIDEEGMAQQQAEFEESFADNPWASGIGYAAGLLTDPVSWAAMLTPAGWVNRARQINSIRKLSSIANKAPKTSAAIAAGAGGAGVGALGYLPEGSEMPEFLGGGDMTRLDMAMMGGAGGSLVGAGSKAVRDKWTKEGGTGEKIWKQVSSPAVSGSLTGAGLGGIAGYTVPVWEEDEDDARLDRLRNTGIGILGGSVAGNRAFTKFPEKFIKNYNLSDSYVSARGEMGGTAKQLYDQEFRPIYDELIKLNKDDQELMYIARTKIGKDAESNEEAMELKRAFIEAKAQPGMRPIPTAPKGKTVDELMDLQRKIHDKVDQYGRELAALNDGGLNAAVQAKNADTYLHRMMRNPEKHTAAAKAGGLNYIGDEFKARGKVATVSPAQWEKMRSDMANPDTAGGVGKTSIDPGFRLTSAEVAEFRKQYMNEVGGAEFSEKEFREAYKGIMDEASQRKMRDNPYSWEKWDPTPDQVKEMAQYQKKLDNYLEQFESGTLKKGEQPPEKPVQDVRVRRDWTQQELKEMGEVTNIVDSFEATGKILAHDVAAGRFLNKVSKDGKISRTRKEGPAYGVRIGDDMVVNLDRLIPNDRKKYGNLANHYVSKETEYDLKSFNGENLLGRMKATTFGRMWGKLNGFWKGTKTILNPNVHVNNITSNIMHFDHGVTSIGAKKWAWLAKSASVLAQKGAGRNSNSTVRVGGKTMKVSKLAEDAERLGVFGGHITDELGQREVAKLFRNEALDNTVWDKVSDQGKIGTAIKIANEVWRRGKSKGKKWLWDKPGAIYQWEDNIFRQGIFMSEIDKLMKDGLGYEAASRAAARKAKEWFVDYENVPDVLAYARELPVPFLSYMYGIVPKLAETAVKQPIKIAKWSAILAVVNEAGWDASDATKEEREQVERLMEAQNPGFDTRWGIPGMGPTQIKIPDSMNPFGEQGDMGFLDLSRAYAGGDIFGGTGAGLGKLEFLPESLQPSFGAAGGVIWPLLGIDQFKGTEIKEGEKLEAIIRQFVPNVPAGEILNQFAGLAGFDSSELTNADVLPETWAGNKIQRAKSGRYSPTKDVHTVTSAWASMMGIKLKPVNSSKMVGRIYSKYDKRIRNYDSKISQLAGELQAGGITEAKYREGITEYMKKQRILLKQMRKEMGG